MLKKQNMNNNNTWINKPNKHMDLVVLIPRVLSYFVVKLSNINDSESKHNTYSQPSITLSGGLKQSTVLSIAAFKWNQHKRNDSEMSMQMRMTHLIMMTSLNGNGFRVTGPLWEEFISHRWIPPPPPPPPPPPREPITRVWCFLWC